MTWNNLLVVLGVLLLLGIAAYFLFRRRDYGKRIRRLPLHLLGFPNIPAVPFVLNEIPDTLFRLSKRAYATTQAKSGLNNTYKIEGFDANGYSYLYGREKDVPAEQEMDRQQLKADMETAILENELRPGKVRSRLEDNTHPLTAQAEDPITLLSLTAPEQFAMSWTTFNAVYEDAEPQLANYAATLTDPEVANREFWPTIAQHGFAYNLLILQKVNAQNAADFKAAFGEEWTADIETLLERQLLYAIDLRFYEILQPQTVKGNPRFTPATLTLLAQDPSAKTLQPIKVIVTGYQGTQKQIYTYGVATTGAWLYALQAAKTSITLYGIWTGHVWHWHIVSAALLMTLNNEVEETHPLRLFMAPQSNFLLSFNDVLLLLWKGIAPPTSVSSAKEFIAMTDVFARGRAYFDDDPDVTLGKFGILKSDFSENGDWDQFPIAGQMLQLWQATGDYVSAFVNHTWANDAAVVADKQLQAWLAASTNPEEGNVAGLPALDSRANLIRTLQSLVFRLTAHGSARLNHSANPVLSFVANFPPCLQLTDIPPANADISTEALLRYLPKTGTIGEMMTFYFTFAFSAPYVPFLPLAGNNTELIFGDDPTEPRNAALIAFRGYIHDFITGYDAPTPQYYQWPRNIET